MTAAPLAGVRVLDLSWVMVGPLSTRYLADLGADVVKVESGTRVDPIRTLAPFRDARPGLQRSLSYHWLNAGKRCVALDLRTEAGREVVLRLAGWADVVIEAFTPGVLDRMGLGYDVLRTRRPDLIMVSTSIAGRSAEDPQRSGVGTTGAALCGATHLIGWPDRPPTGPFGPWTDAVAPRFIVAAILAALHGRRRTGQGGYVDVSQAEAGLQFVLPAHYDHVVNGLVPARRGDVVDPMRAPCGLYPCAGADRWVAIDAAPGPQWEALRDAVGGPLHETRFADLIGRLRGRAELDRAIAGWTGTRDAVEVEEQLQARGVPAHVASTSADLDADRQLRAGHFRSVTDSVIGTFDLPGPQFDLADTPHVPLRRGPLIGEHTHEVLREVCGFDDAAIAGLADAGVLT